MRDGRERGEREEREREKEKLRQGNVPCSHFSTSVNVKMQQHSSRCMRNKTKLLVVTGGRDICTVENT